MYISRKIIFLFFSTGNAGPFSQLTTILKRHVRCTTVSEIALSDVQWYPKQHCPMYNGIRNSIVRCTTVSEIALSDVQRYPRQHCPMYNGIRDSIVRSRINDVSMFQSFKMNYFHFWVLCRNNLQIYTLETMDEVVGIKHFSSQKYNDIFYIIDQVKD